MSIQPAVWRWLVHEGGKLENRSFVAKIAFVADCTKLRLKFHNFLGRYTLRLPILGRETPPPETPPRASRDLCSSK